MQKAWQQIVTNLDGYIIELPTTPKMKREPVWFSATSNGEEILVNKATNNLPSSRITATRTLTYDKFQEVYPLYLRREKGESVSKEVTAITLNSVYYFSQIKHLVREQV